MKKTDTLKITAVDSHTGKLLANYKGGGFSSQIQAKSYIVDAIPNAYTGKSALITVHNLTDGNASIMKVKNGAYKPV